ncbi:MAG: hypothetical protein ACREEG_12235, partial [Phenylobacterium sp.]
MKPTPWGEHMLDYRLYFLDEAGHIQGVVEFDCASDADAIAHARSYADGRATELWRRDRWICRFSGRERPSRAA